MVKLNKMKVKAGAVASKFWRRIRREAGDTLIEVTMALSILSMVLISSTVIAAQAFRLGQTARERTTVSTAAQAQLEAVRAFRDNNTWDHFLHGTATYHGMLSAVSSAGCSTSGSPCMHMTSGGATFTPVDGTMPGPIPTSNIEIVASPGSTADILNVTINYWFDSLGSGKASGHIKTTFSNLMSGPAATPAPVVLPCFTGVNDIVLVMDTSLSMVVSNWSNGKNGAYNTQAAAQLFVTTVQLSNPGNHVAVVGFNGSTPPQVYTPLVNGSYYTSNSSTASSAINSLQYHTGTKYTEGLQEADKVMATGRPGVNQVIIFMSDGLDAEKGPLDNALADNDPQVQAQLAKMTLLDDLYAVGTDNSQSDGLKLMPRGKGTFAVGTNDAALNAIYQNIALGLLACP